MSTDGTLGAGNWDSKLSRLNRGTGTLSGTEDQRTLNIQEGHGTSNFL